MCKNGALTEHYLAIALDPLHVGAGGARLGRVDLPIAREPGTNLPKVPATGLGGAARAYTALATDRYRRTQDERSTGALAAAGAAGKNTAGAPTRRAPCASPSVSPRDRGAACRGWPSFLTPIFSFSPWPR